MRTETAKAPQAMNLSREYPGTIDQVQRVRAHLARLCGGCPVADELILLASELATNAVLHSKSGRPGHTFTVRATLFPGDYAWVEVVDQGGKWLHEEHDDEHGRGLAIVAGIAGDGNWGIEGGTSFRVAWFRLDWQEERAS